MCRKQEEVSKAPIVLDAQQVATKPVFHEPKETGCVIVLSDDEDEA